MPDGTGAAPAPAPAPLSFDIEGARLAGYSDAEIASYVGGLSNFNVEAARKAGYANDEIIDHLAVQPTPPEPPPPASGTLAGVGKAIAQFPTDFYGGLTKSLGDVVTSAGTALQSAARNREDFVQGQGGIINRVDNGEHVSAMDDPYGYADASPEQRAEIRQTNQAGLNAMPAPGATGLSLVGQAAKDAGTTIRDAGQAFVDLGERTFPLTDEEKSRLTVRGTKLATGLLPIIGAAALGGMPALIGLAGLQGYGTHYDAAKQAGASDEDAATAGLFGGLIDGSLMAVPIGKAMEVAAQVPKAFKGEFLKTVVKMAESSATGVTFTQLQTVADNALAGATYDPGRSPTKDLGKDLGLQAAVFAALPFAGAGANAAARLLPRVQPRARPVVVPPEDVLRADTVDDAIQAARDAAARNASTFTTNPASGEGEGAPRADTSTTGTPIDPDAHASGVESGAAPDHGQGALLRLFGNRGTGTVEQTEEGGYQFRTTNAAGDEITHPIEAWNPDAPPDAPAAPTARTEIKTAANDAATIKRMTDGGFTYDPAEGLWFKETGAGTAPPAETISPDTAKTIREHYADAGINVVFYKEDPAIPFDGAHDPAQPNTLFLSNLPDRNVAQVAGHELTHALADTTLPDGTNLNDLLQQQIAANIQNAGWAHARKRFGSTAPKRAEFPAGPQGDAAHAEAVSAHLITELGADIGGEAPKFATFMPRVVDAIQARFGNSVAADVLGKLMDRLRTAMDTIRGFFGETRTRSQNWVTNLGDIHDTLAKMYAERFGTPIEREQAKLAAMKDRAERDRLAAAPPKPAESTQISAETAAKAPGGEIAPDQTNLTSGKSAPVSNAVIPAGRPGSESESSPSFGKVAEPAPTWEATREGLQARTLQLRRWLAELEAERPAAPEQTGKTTPPADTPAMAKVRDELSAASADLATTDVAPAGAGPVRPSRTGADRPSYWMNEGELDDAIERHRSDPLLGPVTRWLGAYRDEVNNKSDGWPYWGASVAKPLMGLIHQGEPRNRNYWDKHGGTIVPTEAELRAAISPIKAFATKHGLDLPDSPLPPTTAASRPPSVRAPQSAQVANPVIPPEPAAPPQSAPVANPVIPEATAKYVPPPGLDREAMPPAPTDPAQGKDWWTNALTLYGKGLALKAAGLKWPRETLWEYLPVDARARLLEANRAPESAPVANQGRPPEAAAPKPETAAPPPEAAAPKPETAAPKPEAAAPKPDAAAPPPRPEPERPERAADFGADNKIFTKDRADAARERIRERLNRLNSGFDPEMATDGLMLAGHYIEGGLRRFADYARAMVGDFGPKIRPFLRGFYESVRHYPGHDHAGMSDPAEIEDYLRSESQRTENESKEQPPSEAGKIQEDGVQGTVPVRDEGAGTEDVHGTAPVGEDGSAPSGEVGGGPRDAPADSGEGTEGLERPTEESGSGEGGRGSGAGDSDRVPAGGETGQEGAAGRPAGAPDAEVTGTDFRIEPGAVGEGRSFPQKARDNLSAIELTKQLIAEDRPATKAEQGELVKYVGWGGLPGVFAHPKTGAFGKGLEKVGARLADVLTPEERRTALKSTQYAHYTAEHVIRSMWNAVAEMGFKGGTVFEPGMGVGHFLGMMPPELAALSKYEGIEMDAITARIAKLLYPESGVREADFTRTPLPENAFDLVIGNPPFSDAVIKADPKYAARGFMLHDYFFAKSLDAVRPGGLLAFVTSAGTMNKIDPEARHYMAERADFMGGVRLPSSAFKKNAGTEVTTDLLFFRKRPETLPLADVGDHEFWTSVVNRRLPDSDGNMIEGSVNRYFSDHPEQVLGDEGYFDKLYKGRYAVHQTAGTDLPTLLSAALDRLPKNVMTAPETPEERARLDFASGQKKEGSFYVGGNGKLMQYRSGAGSAVQRRGAGVEGGFTALDMDRIRALVPMRDALRDVFSADLARDDAAGAAARVALNAHYDRFVAAFGPVNKAEFTYKRPTIVQQEAARLEAREDARESGQYFDDGDFDPTPFLARKTTNTEIATARQQAREAAEAAGRMFNEGTFDPSDMADVVVERRPNIKPFMGDPESYRLRSIEAYNDETGIAVKRRIFKENILTHEEAPQIASANDGVLWSLNTFGRFNLAAIAREMNRKPADIIAELGNSVFKVPGQGNTWQTAGEYLSGDVVSKLETARAQAEHDPDVRRNIAALEAALPSPLAPSEITMTIGMPWLDRSYVTDFIRDVLHIGDVRVEHNPLMGMWLVDKGRAHQGDRSGVQEWSAGTLLPHEILSHAMNRAPPKIYVTVGVGSDRRQVFDPIATQAAQDKVDALKAAFENWIRGDPAREDAVATIYNSRLNRVVPRQFNGDYLTTPGISSEWRWRPHQTAVVSRIIQVGNTYMAHAVGSGKTSAMIGSGMEMRRLGLVKKPMFVVPNHMLAQFSKEFYEQYPTARIMVADEQRFHTDRRRQFVSDVSQSDIDGVIITHSGFGKIGISPEFGGHLIQEAIDELDEALSGLDKQNDRITIKKLEKQKEKLEQRLSKATDNQDITNTFEELGVDFLFVDEAHIFRKLGFASKQQVKGITSQGSDMAWDLYTKVRYLEGQKPGRSAVFASGTPVTNTMGELYSISRYLQPDDLRSRGISHFDSWSQTFGDTKTDLEQTPAGAYAPVTRFAKFVNMPELYKMVAGVMDIVTPAELERYVTRPQLKGGTRQFHLAPRTDALDAYQADLAARVEAIKNRRGPPQKGDDILLSVINDGRHSSIDPRFVMEAGNDPRSKLNQMIENVVRIHNESTDTQFYDPADGYKTPLFRGPATQMIFANLGVNSRGPMNFSGYKWIKQSLIRAGIPANEIAIIGDFSSHLARQALFNDMNEGKVRILIGSSQKMGTGVNAQRRLIALHNQDPLWFPADDEQRVGRMLRQGNLNPEVQVHDYSTKGTYDAVMWGMMGRKGRFIEQFFRGDPNLRDMEDLGEAGMYEQASAMATVDERVQQLTQLQQDLDKAERRETAHHREQYNLRNTVDSAERNIAYRTGLVRHQESDITRRVDTRGDAFSMKVGDETFTTRKEAGAAFKAQATAVWDGLKPKQSQVIAEIGGFPLRVAREPGWRKDDPDRQEYFLVMSGGRARDLSPTGGEGTIQSAETALRGLDSDLEYSHHSIAHSQAELETARTQLGKRFEGGPEIQRLTAARDELKARIKAGPEKPKPVAASGFQPTPGLGFGTEEPGTRRGVQFSPREDQTETPEFRRWFGASKAVDAQGKPLVLYHGTTADFDAFDQGRSGDNSGHPSAGLGFFFTNKPAIADLFTQATDDSTWPPKLVQQDRAQTMPVYLAIHRPFEMSVEKFRQIQGVPYGKDFEREQPEGAARQHNYIAQNRALLERQGYDGIHVKGDPKYDDVFGGEEYAGDAWVAFRPEQIKSAIGNSGAFDPSEPRIQFSPRGDDEDRPPFYSALTRGVEALKQDKATPGQWIATIKNMGGVKGEERAWSGVEDWLGKQPKSVTKGELLDYLRANEVRLDEVMWGGEGGDAYREAKEAERRLGTIRFDASQERFTAKEDLYDNKFPGDSVDVNGSKIGPREMLDLLSRGSINPEDLPETGGLRAAALRVLDAEDRESDAIAAHEEAKAELERHPDAPTRPRYAGYTTPGGENYRELLMTLPSDVKPWQVFDPMNGKPVASFDTEIAAHEDARSRGPRYDYGLTSADDNPTQYKSSHWDDPNILAHIRFDDRTDAEGRKVLHVAEIQSDWHQAGRKQGYAQDQTEYRVRNLRSGNTSEAFSTRDAADEYQQRLPESLRSQTEITSSTKRTEGVPDAPFKTTWPELAFKRVLRFAAEHGYDRVTWDTGKTNADRYGLAKRIASVAYGVEGQMKGVLQAMDHDGRMVANPMLENDAQLADHVGKEVADRLLSEPTETMQNTGTKWHVLSGLDLKFGGEGMHGFYDKMLPSIANKLGKRFGAKVTQGEMDAEDVLRRDEGPNWDKPTPVHAIDVTPAMREGVMQGQPMFSPRMTGAARETDPYTDEEKQAFANVGRTTNDPSFLERMANLRKDLGRRIVQAVFDPFVGVKADDPAGYLALRNANTTSGALLRFMEGGTLKFQGSTYAMDELNGGVENSLIRPLQGEESRFIWWVAAHRAERLSQQDRENLWSRSDIDTLKGLNRGQVPFNYELPNGQTTRSREAIYLDSLRKLDVFNRNVMDLAEESGLISGEAANALVSNPFYVPFYRASEDGTRFSGAGISSGFVKQYAFKSLKGGAEKLNHDLWANAIGNWTHMIDASLRNRAAAGVLDVAVTNGAAIERTQREVDHMMSKKEKENLVWVMNDGKQQFFEVTDPMIYTAITALDFTGFRGPIMDAMTKFKSMLTQGVTTDPRFLFRVAVKDAQQALAVAPASVNIPGNIYRGFAMNDLPGALANVARAVAGREMEPLNLSRETQDAMAGGATMHLGSGHDTGQRKINVDTMLDSPSKIRQFWNYAARIARAEKAAASQIEDLQRLPLYRKLRAEGVPHDAAAFEARDLQDITLRGASPIIRFLTQTVPFFGAMLQGLYKVGRAASNADRNVAVAVGRRAGVAMATRAALVIGATTLAGLALDALYGNDEDYKKRSDYDRDNYYWFKIGGTVFRLPRGFEIASIARIATNGIEAFFGTNEMSGRQFLNSVFDIVGNNLSLSPHSLVPQMFRPMLDIGLNEGGPSGAPIVPQRLSKLPAEAQYTPNTSMLARGVSSAGNSAVHTIFGQGHSFLAPTQLDYLAEGYFGWLGATIISATDMFVRTADQAQASLRGGEAAGVRPVVPVRPSRDLFNSLSGGLIQTETTAQSRYVDMLYSQADALSRANARYHELLAGGQGGEARDYFQAHKDEIAQYRRLDGGLKIATAANAQIRRIENDPKMPADRKHDEIMKYNAMRNKAAENIFGTRP